MNKTYTIGVIEEEQQVGSRLLSDTSNRPYPTLFTAYPTRIGLLIRYFDDLGRFGAEIGKTHFP